MEMQISLEQGMKVAAEFKGHRVLTDQPVKAGGDNEAPAPFDYFVVSIGTCVGFFIKRYCQTKGIDSEGISVQLTTQHNEKKAVTGFAMTISVPEGFPDKLHNALIKVADQCTVKKTMLSNPDFQITVEKQA